MALSMIKKNFSNYSAWHYRAKLMPKFYCLNGRNYNRGYIIPIEKIKEDFATLKHAFFTDPKDQSPWNQHEWLLLQIAPSQIVHIDKVSQDETTLVLKVELNTRVRNFQCLSFSPACSVTEEDGTPASERSICKVWYIHVPITGAQIDFSVESTQDTLKFESMDGVKLFRNFYSQIDVANVEIRPCEESDSESFIKNLKEIAEQEEATVQELVDFEEGLSFATHRLLELK
jgi:hypothetical protein